MLTTIVFIIVYVLFSFGVALLLMSEKRGFWTIFLLSLGFTPLIIGTLGLIFPEKEKSQPT